MYKVGLYLSCFGLAVAITHDLQAHRHYYYVEPVPQQVVVVQQAPSPVVQVVTVQSEPPADLVEQVDLCPGENYVWQKGHWQWNGSWVWTKGGWIQRPYAGSVYVPGYWRRSHHHHHHWEWVAPYWK